MLMTRFFQTLKTVLWAFIGIRRRQDSEQDISQFNIIHVIVAAVICTGLFIFLLLRLIAWILP